MQQGDGANERQVFHVIATATGVIVNEFEFIGEGIDDVQRTKQTLGVLMKLANAGASA